MSLSKDVKLIFPYECCSVDLTMKFLILEMKLISVNRIPRIVCLSKKTTLIHFKKSSDSFLDDYRVDTVFMNIAYFIH